MSLTVDVILSMDLFRTEWLRIGISSVTKTQSHTEDIICFSATPSWLKERSIVIDFDGNCV